MIYHDFSKEIDERSIELGLKNNDVWPILDGPFNESDLLRHGHFCVIKHLKRVIYG